MSVYAIIGLAVVSLAAASCVLNFITFFTFNKQDQKKPKGEKINA